MSHNTWTLLLAAAGLLVNGTGLAFVAVQVALARTQAARARAAEARESVLRRKESTLSFAVSTVEQRRSMWSTLPDDFDEDSVAEFINGIIDGNSDERETNLKSYLTLMETLAAGVAIGIYDVATLSQIMGARVSCVATYYRPYFDYRRRQTGINTLYVELEAVDRQLASFRDTLPECERRVLRQPSARAGATTPPDG